MTQLFGYLSGIFVLLGTFPYLRDIFRKTTKPQRSTWFIYSVLGGISFFSQFAKGATFSLWLTGIDTLSVILIFFLSLWFGVGGFSKKDYHTLLAAAAGLIAWYLTQEAAIALYLVIGIDALGTYLTVEKAYQDPGSETSSAWLLIAIGGIFSMFSVGKFDIVLLSYPFYIFLANATVVLAIALGKRK
ncbi:MAG: hypothetical protein WAV51_02495 [Microgenomates group bacterium]